MRWQGYADFRSDTVTKPTPDMRKVGGADKLLQLDLRQQGLQLG